MYDDIIREYLDLRKKLIAKDKNKVRHRILSDMADLELELIRKGIDIQSIIKRKR